MLDGTRQCFRRSKPCQKHIQNWLFCTVQLIVAMLNHIKWIVRSNVGSIHRQSQSQLAQKLSCWLGFQGFGGMLHLQPLLLVSYDL